VSTTSFHIEHLPADIFGLSEQARSALADRPQPPSVPGVSIPADVASMQRPVELLDMDDRGALSQLLEGELSRFEPHVAVLESARALARPDTFLVVAGQQPALLGGPMYNVFKALHAIRLARALSVAWNTTVLPAFWNHADDHDVAEVHHLWIQNPNLDLFKLKLASMSSGRVPFSRIIFDEEQHQIGAVREALRQNLPEGRKHDDALDLFLPRAGESFSGAFTRLLLSLFGHHGLLVIEPDWIREPLSRSLAQLIRSDLRGLLDEGSQRLEEAGQEPSIEVAGAALVYHLVGDRRHALRFAGEDFHYDDESGSRTAAELAAEIVQDPGAWSPAALLRPLAQDLTLPVAAYIGGWGELAYHAQLPPLRRAVGVPDPPFVPRLSATLVDPESRASLDKLDLALRDALEARGKLGEGNAEEREEPAVARRLREIGERAAREILELRPEMQLVDRGLASQLRRVADRVKGPVERLAGKAERVHTNQQGRGRRHFRRLNHGLVPRGAPQERVRGLIEFAARFGTGWLDQLLEEFEPLPTEHLAIHLHSNSGELDPTSHGS
jgi:bacillithiol synthase